MRTCFIATALLLTIGCEDKKDIPAPAASATPTVTPTLGPPPIVRPPLMSVDEVQCYVGGESVDIGAADARGRVHGVLGTKPKVEGERLELHAARAAKLSRVAALIAGARTAKAIGLRIITPDRDHNEHEIEVTFGALATCAAIASIGKDNAINVWTAGGGTAQRFSKGMAGPDMTRGIEGVHKAAAACDSPAWAIGAEPDMQWGLLFDLASGAMGVFDGGKPMKATKLVVLTEPPVAGRKVD